MRARQLSQNKRIDDVIGAAASMILAAQEYRQYSREHVVDHHSVHHMLMRDPSRRFVVVLEEQALRTRVGSADIMLGQLGRLLYLMSLPRVSVGSGRTVGSPTGSATLCR